MKFILITDHKSLIFLINKIKPIIARKIIFLLQYDFDIIHKDAEKIKHVAALSRYIPNTNIKKEIKPVTNAIQRKQEHNSGLIDINEMCLGELIIQKVRQWQKIGYIL